MSDIRIISGKQITPSLETAARLIGAGKNSTAFSDIEELYGQFLPEVRRRLRPKAALTIVSPDTEEMQNKICGGNKLLYVILTVGDGISRLADQYFSVEEPLKGMLADAMADSCLFAFEEQLLPMIERLCREEGYGVAGRLEIPEDIPIEIQQTVYDALDAKRTLGISITSGYMFDPAKSMCLIFELTEDQGQAVPGHDCSRCGNLNCTLRQRDEVKLHVALSGRDGAETKDTVISCKRGSHLMQVLRDGNILLPAACGGKGTCGKCRVTVEKGFLPVTGADRNCLSQKEIDDGVRLACKAVVQEDITVVISDSREEEFSVLGGEKTEGIQRSGRGDFGIAIDIGTTTLAFSLAELSGTQAADTYTAINHQRAFGADVIARIQAANGGEGEKLRLSIQRDLVHGIQTLLRKNRMESRQLKRIVIAGNTTMLHLLRGYSCRTLGSYPFTPVNLEQENLSLEQIFPGMFPEEETDGSCRVILLSGISAFAGADITSGLYACQYHCSGTLNLFLDLGTNGEMAVGTKDRILVTSAAAGPALEGGNIKWGTGSVPGAICNVKIHQGKAEIRTIGGKAPVGICGTGVIETVAELRKAGLLDETGKLAEPYFHQGYPLAENEQGETIAVTQKDIREIQMAKAAIRAGLEVLLLRYGAEYKSIDKVYLAGGFGYFLAPAKAAAVGLLPGELTDRTEAVGNTSLQGAVRLLSSPEDRKLLKEIAEHAEEIPLAADEVFQELYLKYMMFE